MLFKYWGWMVFNFEKKEIDDGALQLKFIIFATVFGV